MTLSGPGGEWLDGIWNLQLLALTWKVWAWEGAAVTTYSSLTSSWGDVPDLVLAVVAYHERGRRAFMWGVEGYPDPTDPESVKKNGHQIGLIDSAEWLAAAAQIKTEAEV